MFVNFMENRQEDTMTYLMLVWLSVSIGFVLGAVWTGMCRNRKQADEGVAGELGEFGSSAR